MIMRGVSKIIVFVYRSVAPLEPPAKAELLLYSERLLVNPDNIMVSPSLT